MGQAKRYLRGSSTVQEPRLMSQPLGLPPWLLQQQYRWPSAGQPRLQPENHQDALESELSRLEETQSDRFQRCEWHKKETISTNMQQQEILRRKRKRCIPVLLIFLVGVAKKRVSKHWGTTRTGRRSRARRAYTQGRGLGDKWRACFLVILQAQSLCG